MILTFFPSRFLALLYLYTLLYIYVREAKVKI